MCPPSERSLANLNPNPGGEVRNPEGRNQYTYRADAERDLAAWCKRYGRDLIEKLLEKAKAGDATMMKMALDRILPAVQQHDVALTDTSDESLSDRIAALVRARRGNGHDLEPDALGEEETQ